MADPQVVLSSAYPSATEGQAVLDEASGDYWVYTNSVWTNYGPVLGERIDISEQINIFEEKLFLEGYTGTGIKVNSVPWSLIPVVTEKSLAVGIGFDLLTSGAIFPAIKNIDIVPGIPTRPIQILIEPDVVIIDLICSVPSIVALQVTIVAIPTPVGIEIIGQQASFPLPSTQVFPGSLSIEIAVNQPGIQAASDPAFGFTVLQIQSLGEPGLSMRTVNRFFADTSLKEKNVRVIELASRYNSETTNYASSLGSWTNTVKGIIHSSARAKFGTCSMLFASGSSWLQATYNATDAFGTGPFTLEAWVYITEFRDDAFLFNNLRISSTAVFFYTSGMTGDTFLTFLHGGSITANTAWQHIAVTRDASNNVKLFVDGSQIGATQSSASNLTMPVYMIGARNYRTDATTAAMGCNLRAFVQEVRVIKGYANYTASFTVPTEPFPGRPVELPTDSDTNIPDSSVQLLVPGYNTSGSSVPKDYSSNAYTITATGVMTDPKIDPYWDNVTYLLQPDGPDKSLSYTEKKFGYSIQTFGDINNPDDDQPIQTQDNIKYNPYSIQISGLNNTQCPRLVLGNQTTIPVPAGLKISGTDTATIEFWLWTRLKTHAASTYLYIDGATTSNSVFNWRIEITTNNAIRVAAWENLTTTFRILTSPNFVLKERKWQHVAVTVDPTNGVRIYCDGKFIIGDTSLKLRDTVTDQGICLGGAEWTSSNTAKASISGYISEFRVTKGIARYTGSSYIVPRAKFPSQGSVTTTKAGTSSIIKATDPFGNKTKVLNIQDGGRFSIASNSNLIFNKNPFCVEFWLYLTKHPFASDPTKNGFNPLDGPQDTSPALRVDWDYASNATYDFIFGDVKGERLFLGKSYATLGCPLALYKWYHIAYSRDSLGEARVFINGEMQEAPQFLANLDSEYKWVDDGYQDFTTALDSINNNTSYGGGIEKTLNGYMCDIRITKNYARYLSNFTPPTSRFIAASPSDGVQIAFIGPEINLKAFVPNIIGSRPYVLGITQSTVSGTVNLAWPAGSTTGDIGLLFLAFKPGATPVSSGVTNFIGVTNASTYNSSSKGTSGYSYVGETNTPNIYVFKRKLTASSPANVTTVFNTVSASPHFIAARTTAGAAVNLRNNCGLFRTGVGTCSPGYWVAGDTNYICPTDVAFCACILADNADSTYWTAAENSTGIYWVHFADRLSCSSASGNTWGTLAQSNSITVTVRIVRTSWTGASNTSTSTNGAGFNSTLQLTRIGGIAVGGATESNVTVSGAPVWTTSTTTGAVTEHTYTIPANTVTLNSAQIPSLGFTYVGGSSGGQRRGCGLVQVTMSYTKAAEGNAHLVVVRGASDQCYNSGTFRLMSGHTELETSYPTVIWADRMQGCSKATTSAAAQVTLHKPYSVQRNALVVSLAASALAPNLASLSGPASSNIQGLTLNTPIGNNATINSDSVLSAVVYGNTTKVGSHTSSGKNWEGTVEYMTVNQSVNAPSIGVSFIFDSIAYNNPIAYYMAEAEARDRLPSDPRITQGILEMLIVMLQFRVYKIGLLVGFDDIRKCHQIDINPIDPTTVNRDRVKTFKEPSFQDDVYGEFFYSPVDYHPGTINLRYLIADYGFNGTPVDNSFARLVNFNTNPADGLDAGTLYNNNYTDYSPIYGLKGNPHNKAYITAEFYDSEVGWGALYISQLGRRRDYMGGSRKTTRAECQGFGEVVMGNIDLRYFNDNDSHSYQDLYQTAFRLRSDISTPTDFYFIGDYDKCPDHLSYYQNYRSFGPVGGDIFEEIVGATGILTDNSMIGINRIYTRRTQNNVTVISYYAGVGRQSQFTLCPVSGLYWIGTQRANIPYSYKSYINKALAGSDIASNATDFNTEVKLTQTWRHALISGNEYLATNEHAGSVSQIALNWRDSPMCRNRSTHIFTRGNDPFRPNYGSFRIAGLSKAMNTHFNPAYCEPTTTQPGNLASQWDLKYSSSFNWKTSFASNWWIQASNIAIFKVIKATAVVKGYSPTWEDYS